MEEDEGQIPDFIARGLKEQRYVLDVASDGHEALQWTEVANYDVIILDAMLPGIDGIEVCRTARAKGLGTPILMLTARGAVEYRVRGLDIGADDYLIKPFAFTELLARLRALLRRHPATVGNVLQIGDLRVDTTTLEVSRQGKAIDLTSKERRRLEYLMRHPNRVFTRTMIAEHIWSCNFCLISWITPSGIHRPAAWWPSAGP